MATRTKDIQKKAEELITTEKSKAPAQQPLAVPADNPVAYPL
jgi:hypothetical protein